MGEKQKRGRNKEKVIKSPKHKKRKIRKKKNREEKRKVPNYFVQLLTEVYALQKHQLPRIHKESPHPILT